MKQISQKTVKIFIKEVDESYYDETQKVVLDDEAVEPLSEKMEELKLSDCQESIELRKIQSEKLIEKFVESLKNIPEPIQQEEVSVSIQDSQPEIIEEKDHKMEEFNPILDQSHFSGSQVSQITEAEI